MKSCWWLVEKRSESCIYSFFTAVTFHFSLDRDAAAGKKEIPAAATAACGQQMFTS